LHDTILVIFRNVPINVENPSAESELSARSVDTQSDHSKA